MKKKKKINMIKMNIIKMKIRKKKKKMMMGLILKIRIIKI